MSPLFRALALCLLLVPTMVWAQAPAAQDVPCLALELGDEVRVTTPTSVQLGRFRTLDPEQLRLTLPGGQQSSVPLAALTQVEVRGVSRSSVVTGIAAGGGLLFGAAGVLLCNSFNKELSDNGNTAPLPVCGAMGAVLGGALGAGFGLLGTRDWAEWKPVWAR